MGFNIGSAIGGALKSASSGFSTGGPIGALAGGLGGGALGGLSGNFDFHGGAINPKKAVRIRAEDARKAGLHPLATMGLSSAGPVALPTGNGTFGSGGLAPSYESSGERRGNQQLQAERLNQAQIQEIMSSSRRNDAEARVANARAASIALEANMQQDAAAKTAMAIPNRPRPNPRRTPTLMLAGVPVQRDARFFSTGRELEDEFSGLPAEVSGTASALWSLGNTIYGGAIGGIQDAARGVMRYERNRYSNRRQAADDYNWR